MVAFGQLNAGRGMASRIRPSVRSMVKRTKRLTTYLPPASLRESSGANFCVPLVGNGSRQRQWRSFLLGGWMRDAKCLQRCTRGSTRRCFSCLGVYGRSVTPASSTTHPALCLRQHEGCSRKVTSGLLRASRRSQCSWWLRGCHSVLRLAFLVANISVHVVLRVLP